MISRIAEIHHVIKNVGLQQVTAHQTNPQAYKANHSLSKKKNRVSTPICWRALWLCVMQPWCWFRNSQRKSFWTHFLGRGPGGWLICAGYFVAKPNRDIIKKRRLLIIPLLTVRRQPADLRHGLKWACVVLVTTEVRIAIFSPFFLSWRLRWLRLELIILLVFPYRINPFLNGKVTMPDMPIHGGQIKDNSFFVGLEFDTP